MNDSNIVLPNFYTEIKSSSEEIEFSMLSDLQTGSLLRTLVYSKPNGQFLELGTGTGLSLSWIVEAMDPHSKVYSIENNIDFQKIASNYFGNDPRVELVCEDANNWIKNNQDKKFDLIFADAWPGKYEGLLDTLNLLKVGGFYLIDDMLPQSNWPDGHIDNVVKLIAELEQMSSLSITKMNWSTGIVIVTKLS
jgi:predicted O-methyltransferase YrrM